MIGRRTQLVSSMFLLLLTAAICASQEPNPSNPLPVWVQENERKREEFNRNLGRPESPDFRRAESEARATARLPRDRIRSMSEADRKRLAALLAPDIRDLEQYKAFLAQPKTGIFRLFLDSDCLHERLVRVDGDCKNFVLGGESYTFPDAGWSPMLTLRHGRLSIPSFFTQSIFANIGNVPIESVTNESGRLAYIANFIPATTFAEARVQSLDLFKGVERGGIVCADSAEPQLNSTFVLRTIAYRIGNHVEKHHLNRTRGSEAVPFLAFGFDKRIDLLIVFRVIRDENDGNITILWKELARKKSPKITFAAKEKWTDFRRPGSKLH